MNNICKDTSESVFITRLDGAILIHKDDYTKPYYEKDGRNTVPVEQYNIALEELRKAHNKLHGLKHEQHVARSTAVRQLIETLSDKELEVIAYEIYADLASYETFCIGVECGKRHIIANDK